MEQKAQGCNTGNYIVRDKNRQLTELKIFSIGGTPYLVLETELKFQSVNITDLRGEPNAVVLINEFNPPLYLYLSLYLQ